MGDGDRAGLLRVVDEVSLREEIRLLADDLDRVLVGAHRAVGAETVEHRRRDIGLLGSERRIPRERRVRHVIHDADGEVTLRAPFAISSKTALTIAGVNSFDDRP